jgi:hypothetical protein
MWLDNSNLFLKLDFFLPFNPAPCFLIPIWIKSQHGDLMVEALLDIGASTCFIYKNFAKHQNLILRKKVVPTLVEVIDGRPLALANVIEETQPLEIILEDQISSIVFNISQSPLNPVILGLLWFISHNPNVDWCSQRISSRLKCLEKKKVHPICLKTRALCELQSRT